MPGAFLIKNFHHSEFYLKTLTLENVPGHGNIHFDCNSWVYPAEKYKSDRVFFTNQVIFHIYTGHFYYMFTSYFNMIIENLQVK